MQTKFASVVNDRPELPEHHVIYQHVLWYWVVKIPFVYRHYRSYKWLKNITRDF